LVLRRPPTGGSTTCRNDGDGFGLMEAASNRGAGSDCAKAATQSRSAGNI